jgi:hypothetical protein
LAQKAKGFLCCQICLFKRRRVEVVVLSLDAVGTNRLLSGDDVHRSMAALECRMRPDPRAIWRIEGLNLTGIPLTREREAP